MLEISEKDMVLTYLQGYDEYKDEDEVPYCITPRGIAEAVGITERAPYNTLKEIKEEGLIEEDIRFVINSDKKRNVYFLTKKGKQSETEFWKSIKEEYVTLLTEDGEKEMPVKKINNHIGGRNPIVKGLSTIDEEGIINLKELENDIEVFVGRKEEQIELNENLKEVKQEGGKTIFIEGEAGIGKTSLVSKLKPFAQELGFEFLMGTCQSELSDPYLPFKEAFSEFIEGMTRKQETAGMAFIGPGKDEESIQDKRLFDAKKKETFYETTKYIKEIAEKKPLVVFLDDLQWVDEATLDILAYMNDKLDGDPVLFIGAYRPEDVSEDHHLIEMMNRLTRKRKSKKIKLEPLRYEDTEETIKCFLGTEEVPDYFIERIHEKTEGNPLFIKESLRQMLEEKILDPKKDLYPSDESDISVSEMVHNVIERRVNRLDDETVKVVEIGSVIGDPIPFDLLAKTMDLDEIDLLDHIDMLMGNQLWDEDTEGEKFYFSHELIKQTVYKDIKRLKKKLLHKRVANNIEKLYDHELEEWYSDLGRHHEKAQNIDQALDYYLKASENAKKSFAQKDAIEMYKRALKMAKQSDDKQVIDILESLGDTYKLIGEYEKSNETYRSILEKEIEKETELRIYRKISNSHWEKRELDKTIDIVEKGLELVDSEEEKEQYSSEVCKLLGQKAWSTLQRGDLDNAEELFEKEKQLAFKIDDKKLIAGSHHDFGSLKYHLGEMEEATKHFKKAIDIWKDLDEDERLISSLNNLGLVKMYQSEFDEAEEYFKEGLENCEMRRDIIGMATAHNNLGDIYRDRGEFKKGLDHFQKSKSIEEKVGSQNGIARCLNNMAIAYRKMGELETALEHHQDALEIYRGANVKFRTAWALEGLGKVLLLDGQLDKALEKFQEAKRLYENVAEEAEVASTLSSIAEIDLLRGNIDRAEEKMNEAIELSQEVENNLIEGICRRVSGKLYRNKERYEKAEKELFRSEDLLKGVDPIEYPVTLFEIGVLYLEKEDIEESFSYLKDALEMFKEKGMKHWIQKAKTKIDEFD